MGLPILDDSAIRGRDRRDAVALTTAQKLLDAGRADDARAALAPVLALAAEEPTAIRAHACLLYAGIALMSGGVAGAGEALDALARIPARPAFAVDQGYRRMIEACALRQSRRYGEALAAALASVEEGPTPGRLLVLADAQKHAGRVDDACRTLENLLARDPHNATALAQLAGYLHLGGDRAAGARCFARFRDAADDGADCARNAAFVHAAAGDVRACVAALTRALALEPEATRGYIADEVELERFRHDEAFARLALYLPPPRA